MIHTLKQIVNLKASLWVNTFIYYFKRLWFIGKIMPDSFYSDYSLKKILSFIAVFIQQIMDFAGKPLYLLLAVGFPILLLQDINPLLKGQEFSLAVHILFFLSCLIGSFVDSNIFTVSRDKVTFIKYMHINPRLYVKSAFLFRYVPFFIYLLPCFIVLSIIYGQSVFQGFLLWILFVSFRMMGEAFHLYVFARTEKVLIRNAVFQWVLILGGCVLAYLPAALGWSFSVTALVLHPISVLVFAVFGAFCFYYIMVGYQGYETNFSRAIDTNFLLSSMLKVSSEASFKDVEMKENDVTLSSKSKTQFQYLKGYSYFNSLFFARHKRQLVKPVCFRLIACGLLLVASIVFYFMDEKSAVDLSNNLTSILPLFVFGMYFMTVADKACRAMFYNCDKDMLHYAYYRQPQMILKNFKARFVRIALYDVVIAAAICLAATIFCLICGVNIFHIDFLLFCSAIILLSILFTVHHLFLYYVFQPYSESLQVKNPFFTFINTGMYLVCYFCLQIEAGGFVFTMTVLGVTIIYSIVALILVYFYAPKSFRIK